jgi:hypothetical protein
VRIASRSIRYSAERSFEQGELVELTYKNRNDVRFEEAFTKEVQGITKKDMFPCPAPECKGRLWLSETTLAGHTRRVHPDGVSSSEAAAPPDTVSLPTGVPVVDEEETSSSVAHKDSVLASA